MISADLGTQLESFVSKLVKTGRYNSKSEILREGSRKSVRLPSTSAKAMILVVTPPRERPMAWRSMGLRGPTWATVPFHSPFCALSVAVNLDDTAVDHRVFKVGALG